MGVVDEINRVHETKTLGQAEVLRQISDRFTSEVKGQGPVSELLDLVFASTRFQVAPVPGGEVQACGSLLETLITYMKTRADMLLERKNTDYETSLMMALKDLITDSAKLYSEANANLPAKTVEK